MYAKALLLATFLVLGATVAFSAECKMIWIFGIPCHDVYVTLVSQIKNWRNADSCRTGGQSCLYELVSTSPYMVKAKHTSPRKFSNTLQIVFNPAEEDTMCRVTGDSISGIFVDPLDSDINYCSQQNLIDGSGLSKADGYKHFTNIYICVESHAPNCTIG